MVPSVASAGVFGYEKTEGSSSRLSLVSPRVSEKQCLGRDTSVLDVTSHCSESSTSQASATTSNGCSGPISTLLEELLVTILDDVITSNSSSCVDWQLGSPRRLASVSRTWRAIVFACPRLWRYVHLTPDQSIHALKEQLLLSSPLPIHLMVHQWPFRNPILASGAFSIVALTAQLQSILSPLEKEGTTLVLASQRVESITIHATECSTFLNFVLQTWTGRGSKFPALRRVAMNGNVCATWSRACFFDARNAPGLERLELTNVIIAQGVYRLPWGIGLNLTTLVWSAPEHSLGSLIVSVACFHHVVSSFPNLTTLELHEHVVAFEFTSLDGLEGSGVTPLTGIRDLRIIGRVFPNARAAYILFHLLPSLRDVTVRGRACTGSIEMRTVTLALQGLIFLPKVLGWPNVLPSLENVELECVEEACTEWMTWCMRELGLWRQWRETLASAGKEVTGTGIRVHVHELPIDVEDEDE